MYGGESGLGLDPCSKNRRERFFMSAASPKGKAQGSAAFKNRRERFFMSAASPKGKAQGSAA